MKIKIIESSKGGAMRRIEIEGEDVKVSDVVDVMDGLKFFVNGKPATENTSVHDGDVVHAQAEKSGSGL